MIGMMRAKDAMTLVVEKASTLMKVTDRKNLNFARFVERL